MNDLDERTKADIENLLTVARPKLIEADKGGGPKLFNEVIQEFGPIAHRVYLTLDKPQRSCDRYHDKETRRVMLDPWTVFNRAKSLGEDSEITMDNQYFWMHGDMIKTLCDYLDQMEVAYASA